MPFFSKKFKTAEEKFQENADMGLPFLSFYCSILSRLSYFSAEHFLPAYLETMGPIIPDKLLTYINNSEAGDLLPFLPSDVGSLEGTEGGKILTDDTIPKYTFGGKKFVDYTEYAEKFNKNNVAREKKPYKVMPPRIIQKTTDHTVAYTMVSTSNYGGNFILIDTRMPNCIFVIFRGTYSGKSAGAYTKPSSLKPSIIEKADTDGKKYASLKGIHKLLYDDLNAIFEAMGRLVNKYLRPEGDTGELQDNSIKVITTGHSLGGGLSTLFAASFYELHFARAYRDEERFRALKKEITCVSIAAPRVLDDAYCQKLADRIRKKQMFYQRMIVKTDPVPSLPPSIKLGKLKFSHPCDSLDKTDPVRKSVTLRLTSRLKIPMLKINYGGAPEAKNVKPSSKIRGVNPLAHTEYMYVQFTKAVDVGAFLSSSFMPKKLMDAMNKEKRMEIQRDLEGHTMVRILNGDIRIIANASSEDPEIIHHIAMYDLTQLREKKGGSDSLLTQKVWNQIMQQEKIVEGDPNITKNFNVIKIKTGDVVIPEITGLVSEKQRQETAAEIKQSDTIKERLKKLGNHVDNHAEDIPHDPASGGRRKTKKKGRKKNKRTKREYLKQKRKRNITRRKRKIKTRKH